MENCVSHFTDARPLDKVGGMGTTIDRLGTSWEVLRGAVQVFLGFSFGTVGALSLARCL